MSKSRKTTAAINRDIQDDAHVLDDEQQNEIIQSLKDESDASNEKMTVNSPTSELITKECNHRLCPGYVAILLEPTMSSSPIFSSALTIKSVRIACILSISSVLATSVAHIYPKSLSVYTAFVGSLIPILYASLKKCSNTDTMGVWWIPLLLCSVVYAFMAIKNSGYKHIETFERKKYKLKGV